MGTLIRTKDLCKIYIVNKQSNNVLQNVNLSEAASPTANFLMYSTASGAVPTQQKWRATA